MRLPATFAAFHERDYRLLWIGAVGSMGAAQMLTLARGYLAYELTGSATALAVVVLAHGGPGFFLGLFGGVVADRVKRRKLLVFTQSGLVLNAVITAVLVSFGIVEIWQLIILGVFQGSVLSFNQPSRQAYLIELSHNQVGNAIALYNSGGTAVRIIGPSLAGALIALPFVGITGCLWLITCCYMVPVIALTQIKAEPQVSQRRHKNVWAEFTDGIRYIRHHEMLKILVIAGIVPPLIGNFYQQIQPVFAKDVLSAGSEGLGLMITAAGIGALLGSLAVATFGNMRRRGLAQLCAGFMFGVTLIVFSRVESLPAAIAALTAVGFAASSYQTLNSTLIVGASDPEYYGRVSSVQQLNSGLQAFAILPMGFLVDQLSAPAVILMNGLGITIFWAFIAVFVRSYRRMELPHLDKDDAETEAPATPVAAPAERSATGATT